jgi:hypothetical protein
MIIEFLSLFFSLSVAMQLATTRKSDMIKNCQGLNKTTFGLNAEMKQNCYMSYALQDCEKEVEKSLPAEVSEDYMRELGLEPTPENKILAESIFKKLRTNLTSNYKAMSKSLAYEKQQYHICQMKSMDYLKLYSGNALLTDESTKRMAYWDKVQNSKDNLVKQQANQTKAAKNSSSADFRKNRGNGGQQSGSSNQNKGGGGNNNGGGKPWVQPWANQSSEQSSSSSSNSNYQGNNYNPNYSKPFTPKKCPKCLENSHGNAPCKA